MEKLGTSPAGLDRAKASLGLFSEYAKSFRTDVNHRWIENYFNQILRSRLAGLFGEAYGGGSGASRFYMLDEAVYESGTGVFLGRFVNGFDKIMRSYKVSCVK
jgi:hypothetical protein